MDKRYEIYCTADPHFYDAPTTIDRAELRFAVEARGVPAGWRRVEQDDWLVYRPPGVPLGPQGWKVHASACLANADEVLATVWDYCVPRLVPFKFLRGRHIMLNANAKYADRGASGKLVTIYPADEAQLELVLTELGELLAGQPGPYILSDLRWADGPLFVRYGGFGPRHHVFDRGVVEPAIVDDAGRPVPDRREPRFTVPAWVTLPDFLVPHLKARTAPSLEQVPYRVERALHFSNGGGLYLARDTRTDEQVVLKEARPHAGLSADGRDAVARQERERTILAELAGLDVVPRLRDQFVLDGHHFLVQDYVDGRPLRQLIVQRYPLLTDEPDPAAVIGYTEWALDLGARVEEAVAALHTRGIAMNDLHPNNVLVRPDGSVALVDFEVATRRDEQLAPALGNPSFTAPRDVDGVDRDRYALACLRLFFFLPLTAMFPLDPDKPVQLAEVIATQFPVPPRYLAEALDTLRAPAPPAERSPAEPKRAASPAPPMPTADPTDWPAVSRSLADAIVASATPQRQDRLFPGDIGQFVSSAPGLAHGAAGPLYALHLAGYGVDGGHLDWLARRATSPEPGSRIGFYDGLHGAAYVLDLLGRRQAALDVLDICLRERWTDLGLSLAEGLSGIGLNLAHVARRTGEPALAEAAQRALELVADRLGDVESVPTTSGGKHPYAGLLRGSAGPALLFLREYERTGEAALLDLAATALRQDLRRCVLLPDGSRLVDEGWRTMPYLLNGSIGIGMVLHDYLRHRPDEDLAVVAGQIDRVARSHFFVEPGLFSGRAGMILYLSRQARDGAAGRQIAAQVQRLSWHAMSYRGHLAFPGDQLLRLSMDLATGNAGVLLALAAASDPHRAYLPFLAPRRPSTPGPSVPPATDRILITHHG